MGSWGGGGALVGGSLVLGVLSMLQERLVDMMGEIVSSKSRRVRGVQRITLEGKER